MPKKVPQRMCVSCREMKDKRALLRLVRTPEQALELDLTGKKAGRGAYICADAACLQKAQKSRAVERALAVKPGPEFWPAVEAEVARRAEPGR